MRIETVSCPVLGTMVTRVVDLEGRVDRVICPEYQASTRTCRVKRTAGTAPPLSRLLQRVHDNTVAEHTATCSLG